MTKEEADRLIVNIRDEMYEELAWYVWNHCHDELMTEDVLQEVFLEVCRHIETLASHESYRGWLYKTAKYKLMKMTKEAARRDKIQTELSEIKGTELAFEDEHEFLVFDEYSHILSQEKLALLKEHYYKGKTLEEIARENSKTLGAIKMQLKRVREDIRKHFIRFE